MNIANILIYLALLSQILVLSVLLPWRMHQCWQTRASNANSAASALWLHQRWLLLNATVALAGLILFITLLQGIAMSVSTLFGYSLLQVGVLFLQQRRLSRIQQQLQTIPAQRKASLRSRRLSQFLSPWQAIVMLISVIMVLVLAILMWQQGIWSQGWLSLWQLLAFCLIINGALLVAMFRTIYRKREDFSSTNPVRTENMQHQVNHYAIAIIVFNSVVILLMQFSMLQNKTAAIYVTVSFLLQAILLGSRSKNRWNG